MFTAYILQLSGVSFGSPSGVLFAFEIRTFEEPGELLRTFAQDRADRSVLGKGPPQFQEFFERADTSAPTRATRQSAQRHNKQLVDVRDGRFLEVVRRSAFGLIAIYNMLPQTIVDEETVCGFQRCLQEMAKQEVAAGNDAWSNLFSPRIELYRHPLRTLHSVR